MDSKRKIEKIPKPIINKIRTNTIKQEIKKYKSKKQSEELDECSNESESNGFCKFYKSRLKMLKCIPPSHSIQDINTIKWLKRTHSKEVLRACVNKLLDDEEEEKSISHINKSNSFEFNKNKTEKENKFYKMNPKYFWTQEKYQKILKLKELFKEFDVDGNQQMEINEIESMFKTNNIDASSSELTKLFGNGVEKKKNKNIIFDFYQFCNFSIEHDLEFAKFLRGLKLKETNKNDSNYYPRSFNSLLDYFISKGEERKSVNKINSIIKNMDIVRENNQNNVLDCNELIKTDKKMDFYELMSEFKNLFQLTLSNYEIQRKRRNKEKKEKDKEKELNVEQRNNVIKRTNKLADCKRLFDKIIKKQNFEEKDKLPMLLPLMSIKEKKEPEGKIKRRHFNSCIYIPPQGNI